MSQGKKDRELGMDREISRRDFLNGVGVAVGASPVAPGGMLGDFAGHAKRDEFTSSGKRLIGSGGTQPIAGTNLYSAQAKKLFVELGIEVRRFGEYNDQNFYTRPGLGQAVFFDKETFGGDRLVLGIAAKQG